MRAFAIWLSIAASLAFPHFGFCADTPQKEDMSDVRVLAEQFLRAQSSGFSGQVSVTVGAVDSRLRLSPCTAAEAFLPLGNKAWGKTTVGVRCSAPTPWKIYIPANVHVVSDYIVNKLPLIQGQSIQESDLTKTTGDLASLPAGVITDASQAVGRTVTVSLKPGSTLRSDMLRNRQAAQQGQTVQVTTSGPGFKVTVEGKALTNAADGQVLQARTASGQVVSGIARMGGVLEVVY